MSNRSKERNKPVADLTSDELASEKVRMQTLLSLHHHPGNRKSMQARLRQIKERLQLLRSGNGHD